MKQLSRAFRNGFSGAGFVAAAILTATLAAGCGGGGGGGGGTSAVDSDKPGAIGTGSASMWLSWRAPTERENGDALAYAELGGYRVYWGPVGNPVANSIEVADGTASAYQIDGIAPGTYEVAVSAIDTSGLESALSDTMITSVN